MPGHLVGGDRGAHAAAADEHAALGAAVDHGPSHRLRGVGVVDGLRGVRAHVEHLVPVLAQQLRELLLEDEAGVVGADDDAHARDLRASWSRGRGHDAFRLEAELLLQLLERRRGAERVHADDAARRARRSAPSRGSRPARPQTRAVTDGGSTASRYSAGCSSNSSHDGMLTTRLRTPFLRELLVGGHAQRDLAAGGQEQHLGLAVRARRPARRRPCASPDGRRRTSCGRASAAPAASGSAPAGSWRNCRITRQASATSLASPGRIVIRPGIARSDSSCSTGWCVGPSSPTPIESCVKT